MIPMPLLVSSLGLQYKTQTKFKEMQKDQSQIKYSSKWKDIRPQENYKFLANTHR